jgi:anti-sigma regulatory factor (Ser/Thr protein kinase)
VTDDGQGYDPPALAGDGNGDLSEGGLGIAIIRALADEVEIGARESGGSRLRFVKFLDE